MSAQTCIGQNVLPSRCAHSQCSSPQAKQSPTQASTETQNNMPNTTSRQLQAKDQQMPNDPKSTKQKTNTCQKIQEADSRSHASEPAGCSKPYKLWNDCCCSASHMQKSIYAQACSRFIMRFSWLMRFQLLCIN